MVEEVSNSTQESTVSQFKNQHQINIEPEDQTDHLLISSDTNRDLLANVIPELKFRDVIIAKKFGTDYDTDRFAIFKISIKRFLPFRGI